MTINLNKISTLRPNAMSLSRIGKVLLLLITNLSLISNAQTIADYKILELTPNRLTAESYGSPFVELNPPILSSFIRRIFQDSQGVFWFGTNGDGVIRYDGIKLTYFSIDEGFVGGSVRSILEDSDGKIWFGTNQGIAVYSPNESATLIKANFKNYTAANGLIHNDVWFMIEDSQGIIWIGTVEGLCFYDGESFINFELPLAEPDLSRGVSSGKIVHSIMEDKKGNIWFGTNGGAYIYAPQNNNEKIELINISEKEGLPNNNVNCILQDRNGYIWFATTHGGICRYNPNAIGKDAFLSLKISSETVKLDEIEVWSIFEDYLGNIWFPVKNLGVGCFDGVSIHVFTKNDGLSSTAIQCIYEDQDQRIWLGGWMGLYRYDSTRTLTSKGELFFQVTK